MLIKNIQNKLNYEKKQKIDLKKLVVKWLNLKVNLNKQEQVQIAH